MKVALDLQFHLKILLSFLGFQLQADEKDPHV